MDDNKNNDLSRLIPEMQTFSDRLSSTSSQENILIAAQRAAALQAKRQAEAQQKLADSISGSISGVLSFTKGLQSSGSSGDFGAVNKVIDVTTKLAGSLVSMIPVVGGAFQGLVEGAGDVAKFMVGQFAKAYGNFERLSDSGVVTTFEDMKSSMAATGLNMDDTVKVFTKYSVAMANFGGASVLGRKRLDMIADESRDASKNYQKIGFSAEEFLESQVQYISQLQLAGGLKGLTDKQIRDGSIRYIDMIDALSKTTGVGRKELKDQIDERQRNARYLAGVANLGEKQQTEITKVLSQFNVADPELSEGLQDLIAADGRVTTEKAKAAYIQLSRGGMDVRGEIAKLRSDGSNAADFMNASRKSAGNYVKSTKELTSNVGENTIVTRNFVGMSNLSLQKDYDANEIQSQIDARRQETLNKNDGTGSDLANTRRNLYQSGNQLELLATSSKTVTSVMNTMATGMDKVTSTIYAAIGEELPPYLALRKKENESVAKTVQLQGSRSDTQKKLADLKEKKSEMTGDPNSARNRSLRNKYDRAEKNMESELSLLDLQIKEQELETQDIKKKRVTAENAPTSSPGSGPPSGQSATTPSGSSGSTPPSGSGSSNSQSSGSAPPTAGTTPNLTSAPGLGARESEQREVNQPGYGTGSDSGERKIEKIVKSEPGVLHAQMNDGSVVARQGPVAWRMNNPGNLRYADWEKEFNVLGQADAGSSGKFAVFPTAKDGIGAQRKLIFDKYAGLTIFQLMSKYDNATAPQYTKIVTQAAGISANTLVKDLTTTQQDSLVKSIHKHEGYRQGVERVVSAATGGSSGQPAAPKPARTGGIFSGPSTGYLAELHGDEAVIPTNDGASKQQFEKLMGGSDNNEDMTKIFKMMSSKINSMISIANDGVGIQQKAKKSNITMA